MGPFAGFAENETYMLNVLRMHRDASYEIEGADIVPPALVAAGQQAWEAAVRDGEEYGVRNSQASVLAPTGTIGLMMDCDTTGIEPDLGLVKMKKLVGGGNDDDRQPDDPACAAPLGYTAQQVDEIIAYIDTEKTILGAPHLAAEHVPVFACSMGDNTIHYEGHVRMMGAVQPFLSGAISKTVNMPERRRSKTSRSSTCCRGSSASRPSRSTATTARSRSRSARPRRSPPTTPPRAPSRRRPPPRRSSSGSSRRSCTSRSARSCRAAAKAARSSSASPT
jgi:ribonucleoside-diphosphate reductase alpha chain